jgi:hypothetical protein
MQISPVLVLKETAGDEVKGSVGVNGGIYPTVVVAF